MALSENNIDKLRASITRLITLNKGLEAENQRLQNMYKAQGNELEKSNGKVASLESQLTGVLLNKSILEVAGGVKNARSRVNSLIRDIDRCISIMNR